MNFLAHFAFNHEVCGRPAEPYFATGVVLPDLWPQLVRGGDHPPVMAAAGCGPAGPAEKPPRRRISWRAVRDANPAGRVAAALRAGLLNHVEIDQRFHTSTPFASWQRAVRDGLAEPGGLVEPTPPPLLRDFLAHLCVEIALDQHLLARDPDLAERFYSVLERASPEVVEREMTVLAAVDARGLADLLRGFVRRRTFCRLLDPQAAAAVVEFVINLTPLRPPAAPDVIPKALSLAYGQVRPDECWSALGLAQRLAPAPSDRAARPAGRPDGNTG